MMNKTAPKASPTGKLIALLIAAILLAFAGIGTYLLGSGGWSINSKGELVMPYELRHPEATGPAIEYTVDGNSTEYYAPEYGYMAEPIEGAGPLASPVVKNLTPIPAQCTDKPLHEVTPEPGSWVVPSLPDGAGGVATGYFSAGYFSAGIPSAPQGVLSLKSAPLGTGGKPSVLAGHVNMDYPNDRLSSWGMLHYIDKCAHVYITDLNGTAREYKVVLIDTIDQAQTESDRQLWGDVDSAPEVFELVGSDELVWLLTCSGVFIGDSGAGSTYTFPYTHNLKVGLTPVREP